jgi:hypothetical protein
MGTRWIAFRRKSELQLILKEFGLDTNGTVEEMRSRLVAFAGQGDLSKDQLQRLLELETSLGNAVTPDPKQTGTRSRDASPAPMEDDSEGVIPIPSLEARRAASPARSAISRHTLPVPAPNATFSVNVGSSGPGHKWVAPYELADRVRKWGVAFNGDATDPWGFIEQLEEKAALYSIDVQQLPQAVANVLTGQAEDWFRVNTLYQVTWEEFKQEFMDFFLPPRYFQRLEDDIRSRTQRRGERFRDYALALRLMMRRAKYTKEQELDRIYDNMMPEYQLFTRRHEFGTLAQLDKLVITYETTKELQRQGTNHPAQRREEPKSPNPPTTRNTTTTTPATMAAPPQTTPLGATRSDAQRVCHNCAQPGHMQADCRNNRVLFCWDCGRHGVRTVDCCRRTTSGNAARLQPRGNSLETPHRSSQE